MHKTYKIDTDHSIVLDSSMGWFLLYREYFGHDIMPDLLPAMETVLHAIGNTLGVIEGDSVEEVVKAVTSREVVDDFIVDITGMEISTMLNIFWALAKNEDNSIPEPRTFFNQFESFPVDELAPQVFRQILNSSISSKNLKRLGAKYPFVQTMLSSER